METTTQQGQRSLMRKLAEVMGAVSHVPKTGKNTFHNYNYATEADIVASVRKAMAERHLMLVPDVERMEVKDIPRKAGGSERLATLTVRFTLLDGDSGEDYSFHVVGEGTDQGDKATYKAMTGAVKYALLKLFLIPTGDDPEKDDEAPQRGQQQGRREAPRSAAPKAAAPSPAPALTPEQQEKVRQVEKATGGKAEGPKVVEAPAKVMFGVNKGRIIAKLSEEEVSGSLSEADAALADDAKKAYWPAIEKQRALLLGRLDEVTQPLEPGHAG